MNNHTFTRTAPRDPAADYVRDPLFRVDRRDNALAFNPRVNNHVRIVTNDGPDNWKYVRDQVAARMFGDLPGVRQAYVRDALRPVSRAGGRSRFRD